MGTGTVERKEGLGRGRELGDDLEGRFVKGPQATEGQL
jgi:hypothetical protein